LCRNFFIQDEKNENEVKANVRALEVYKSFDLPVYNEVQAKINSSAYIISKYVNDRLAGKRAMNIPQMMFFVAQDLMTSLQSKGKKEVTAEETLEFLFKDYTPRRLPINFTICNMIYDTLNAKRTFNNDV
jgi:hypothetical protein